MMMMMMMMMNRGESSDVAGREYSVHGNYERLALTVLSLTADGNSSRLHYRLF